jgi:DNA-directed RNA polymerase specialized sigma24 family protein
MGVSKRKTPNRQVQRDHELAQRCLQGEIRAWDELFRTCHPVLLTVIRRLLGPQANDPNLVEETAAVLWYQLVCNRGEFLARFDAERNCRLTTFLGRVARNQVRVLWRSESRRQRRELAAAQDRLDRNADDLPLSGSELEEFIQTLTPREREFFVWSTSPSSQNGKAAFRDSTSNEHQLRHRLRRKVRQFFREEPLSVRSAD